MVLGVVLAGFLDRQNVLRFFHNADRIRTPVRAGAVVTGILVGKIVTARTRADLVIHLEDGLTQARSFFSRAAQDVVSQTLRRFLPYPRQLAEFFDQPLDRLGEITHLNLFPQPLPGREIYPGRPARSVRAWPAPVRRS